MYEELIIKRIIERVERVERVKREIEKEALLKVETETLDNAIQSNNKNKLRHFAGDCLWTDPCWLIDDIECDKCQTFVSSNPIIKQKSRIELNRIIANERTHL
jgi:hypothetical protein